MALRMTGEEQKLVQTNIWTCILCHCLKLRLAVCQSMTEWGTCHKDRLCATVPAWESWCVSNIPCLISFTKILNFGEAWFLDPIRCCKNLRLSIYSVYIPTLFISLSHPAFVSHIYHSVIIVQHFFHDLRFIGGARETSSVISENWMYVLAQLKNFIPKWMPRKF